MTTRVSEDVKLNIKEVLREKGVMSKDLADYLGITTVAMSKIINNKTTPSLGTLARIAKYLNMKLSTLLGEEPLKVVDSSGEFAAFVRCNGKHYTADTMEELEKIVDEIRAIAK